MTRRYTPALLIALVLGAFVVATAQGPLFTSRIEFSNGVCLLDGTGDPEGSKTAAVGCHYYRTNGWIYDKVSGSSNTGWQMRPASIEVSLTDAQVKQLPTTPFTVAAAPGSGRTIVLHSAYLLANFAAGAYTGASTTLSYLTLTNSSYIANDNSVSPALTYLTVFLDNTKKKVLVFPWQDTSDPAQVWGTLAHAATAYTNENQALQVSIENGGVNLGGGHGSNTLRIRARITIESVN